MWQCNGPENTCSTAADAGVSLLHGCGEEFVKDHEMKIQTIFEAFEHHQLGEEDPSQLLAEIVTKLPKVEAGRCAQLPNIDSILVTQLRIQIERLNRQLH